MRLLHHILYIESRTFSMIEKQKNQALFLNKAWPTTQTQNKTRQTILVPDQNVALVRIGGVFSAPSR